MENRNMDKDEPNKEGLLQLVNKEEQAEENSCLSTRLIEELEPQHLRRLENPHFTGNCAQKLLFHNSLGLQNKLPKHIISFDERYFLRCLELVHIHSTCPSLQRCKLYQRVQVQERLEMKISTLMVIWRPNVLKLWGLSQVMSLTPPRSGFLVL